MIIVITSAPGNPRRIVADGLLERTDPDQVVLVTRDPSRLDDLAQRGAQVRAGDFADPSSLPSAFEGVTKALIISTAQVGYPLSDEPWGVRRFFVEDPGGTIVKVLAHSG